MFLILCLLCWLCIFIANSKQQKKAYYERQHQSYKTYERKEFNKKPFFIIVGIIVFLFLLGYSFRQGRITMRTEMQQIAAETKEEHDEEIAKLKEEHEKEIKELKEQYEKEIKELNDNIENKESEINNLNLTIEQYEQEEVTNETVEIKVEDTDPTTTNEEPHNSAISSERSNCPRCHNYSYVESVNLNNYCYFGYCTECHYENDLNDYRSDLFNN